MTVVVGLVVVCAVGWSFFMGFMVGKGQNPRASIEEMTGLMRPEAEEKNAGNPEKKIADVATLPDAAMPASPAEEKRQIADAAPVPPAVANAADNKQNFPFTRPEGEGTAAWPASDIKDKKPAVPATKVAKDAAAKNIPVFNYSYQVAVYKNRSDADKLRAEISSRNMTGNVQKSGKAWLVTVNFRGGENEVAALNQKARSLKLGAPLLLSKKPAATAASPAKPLVAKKATARSAPAKSATQKPAASKSTTSKPATPQSTKAKRPPQKAKKGQ